MTPDEEAEHYKYLQIKAKMGQDGPSLSVPAPQPSATPYKDIWAQPDKGIGRKAWESLAVPEQTASKILGGLAQKVPEGQITGNMGGDLARGTPRILANTAAQALPGFVSRGAILTAGALPVARGLGKAAEVVGPGIASQLESLSGMKPGLLGKAFRDPSLIFSRISPEARAAYQESSAIAAKSPEVSETARPLALVQKLMKKAKAGMISPDEALAGRQATDQLWRSQSITENFKNIARDTFDAIAKRQPQIAEADVGFSRGKQAAGLRNLMPQNKYGGTSAFKTAIMAALSEMGLPGRAAMTLMSPAVMGAGATGLGAAAKVAAPLARSPGGSIALQQLISRLIGGGDQQ